MQSSAQVEYYCARDHVTRVLFNASALLEVPAEWGCETCGQTATRNPHENQQSEEKQSEDTEQSNSIFTASHHAEFQKRRSAAEAEKLLNDALEKIKTTLTD